MRNCRRQRRILRQLTRIVRLPKMIVRRHLNNRLNICQGPTGSEEEGEQVMVQTLVGPRKFPKVTGKKRKAG